MGRRSRKRRASERAALAPDNRAPGSDGSPRAGGAVVERPGPVTARTASGSRAGPNTSPRRPRRELPLPPWHPFPLAELCILAALVMGVVGFVVWGSRGQLLVAGAMILASAATLEFTLREHLAGYRSHSTLLGGVVAAASAAAMFVAGVARPAVVVVAAALFLGALVAFREVFKRRSGGLAWCGGPR